MVAARGGSSRVVTRIALSPTGLVAVDDRLRTGSSWHAELSAPPDGSTWPALGAALRELAAALGATHGQLRVVLLSPLVEVRRIELPPLRDDERLRLLSRTAERYFVGAREPQVVGVAPPPRGKGNAVVCAAVPARLLAMIHAEAATSGWTVENIVPAEAAWLTAAAAMWPSLVRRGATLLVAHDDRVDLVQAEDGRLTGVRRFRSTDIAAIVEALHTGRADAPPTVALFGDSTGRQALASALATAGINVTAPPTKWETATATPSIAAATFVAADDPFRLRTDDALALRAARAKRIAWQLGLAATLLVMTAAAVEWWGVRRELDVVRAQRAELAPRVRELLSGQQVNRSAARRIANITESHRATPQWSAAIAALSEKLDDGAYLLNLRARGDTVLLDGLAARSSEAFASVERVTGFAAVRAAGEMRVERQDDGTLLERFTIQARVVRDQKRSKQ